MEKMIHAKFIGLFIAILMLFGFDNHVSAQIFFNNGAQVYVAPSAIVQINGGFQNDNAVGTAGDFDNEGDMTITSNGSYPGNVLLTNNSTLHGNGTYHVEQDWINDATFTADNSTVELYGSTSTQLITSNNGTVTTFDTLKLTGTGTGAARIKKQTLDAKVAGALILNDRELATDVNTMFITTPNLTAVTNNQTPGNEGFVSSLANGSLSRVTNSSSPYFFPTGSSLGTTRYRPVDITPASSNPDTYTVRLANNNATNDGYNITALDSTLCNLNPLFYHKINRTSGSDNADIDVFYDQTADGAWDGLAQWNTPQGSVWNNMGTVTATTGSPYSDVLKTNWSDFSNDPYVLAGNKPAAPTLTCAGMVCPGASAVFTVSGNSNSYTWNVPSGVNIVSGQGTDSLVVNWGNTSGSISVVANSSGGCASLPDNCSVTAATAPVAGFDTASSGPFLNNYAFSDTSSGGATSWVWNFGDGTTSTDQNPVHYYSSSGTYPVTEVVTNANGCIDSIQTDVTVNEGIIIPNVFSPNDDGVNDQFYIANSGLKEFSIQIYNRWGTKIFESTASEIRWDGKSTAGVKQSDGTYYYILKAITDSGKDYSTTGYVSIVGSKNN